MIRTGSNGDRHEDSEDPLEPVTTNGVERSNSTMSFQINDVQFPLILVLGTSFVLLIAVMTCEEEVKSRGYAVAVPILSLILSPCYLLLTIFKEQVYNMYGKHMTTVLFIWNFSGASFLTFSSPFTTTGNGYFAAWGCVVASAMTMGFSGDAFRSRVEGLGPLLGLCGSAFIVVIALIDFIGSSDSPKESMYGMIVSIITILVIGGFIYYEKQLNEQQTPKWFLRTKLGLLLFFALLWLVLACLVTFRGPFDTTGNGYFASWAGATCVWFATFAAWKDMEISTEDVVGFLIPSSNTGLSATIS